MSPIVKQSTKVRWKLLRNRELMGSIGTAVSIRNDAANLYPQLLHIYRELDKYGVSTPKLRRPEHSEWGNHHITVLLRLKRRLHQKNLDLLEWEEWARDHEDRFRKLTTQPAGKKPSEEIKTTDSFLIEQQDQLRDAIQEDNNLVFFRKIERLYPKFQDRGIQMLKLRPFILDSDRYRNYHVGLLKDLDLQITRIVHDGISLDLERWGQTVSLREKARDVLVREEEPVALLDELELQMLQFIHAELKKGVVVSTGTVYCHDPFLKVSPTILNLAFCYLADSGYISATEAPHSNPMAVSQNFTVTAVTQEGRKALIGSHGQAYGGRDNEKTT